MAIPDYQTIMLPLVRFLGDGKEHAKREAVEYLTGEFGLTEDERKELLPSGKQPLFGNRENLGSEGSFTTNLKSREL